MWDIDGRLVAALYEAIVDEVALEQAIDAIARRLGCHSACIVSFDPLTPQAAIALSAGAFDDMAKRRYETDFAAHDPAPAAFAAAPSGTVFASNRFLPRDYLRRSVMLHEFLRPHSIEETIGGTVSARDGRFAFFTVHRGADRADFDDDDIAGIEAILPHIDRALQLRRAFAKLETTAALLGGVIDRLSAGVVVVQGDGSVAHVNAAARAIAAREDGLRFDRKGLPHAVDHAAERLLTQHRLDVMSGGSGDIVRLPRRDQRQPYSLLVAPLPAGAALGADAGAQRGVLFLIHDPDMQSADTAQTIASIYRMPQGAAQVVAALMEGEDAKTYAEKRNISYETVRYHLKTAFERTGMRSQGRMMQLVTRALTELRGRE
jgi:DNA-binding CsgD family transcriptional regulator/GAF domain-containing protein